MEIDRGKLIELNNGVIEGMKEQVLSLIEEVEAADIIPSILEHSRLADELLAEGRQDEASVHSSVSLSLIISCVDTDDPVLLPIVDVFDMLIGNMVVVGTVVDAMSKSFGDVGLQQIMLCHLEACRRFHKKFADEEIVKITTEMGIDVMNGKMISPQDMIMTSSKVCAAMWNEMQTFDSDLFHLVNCLMNPIRQLRPSISPADLPVTLLCARYAVRGAIILWAGIDPKAD